ncbi:hypothetical protein WN51_08789 [Melipona quadrifasciata]|uniref:Uncharacterized protein n=1 Tax=Melipona quadrifasciata TaxID=166423 RepID=A0A0N0U343_9HYME|nr:hypothetical protein WN51_08789 [Melipona quadrifasciata]
MNDADRLRYVMDCLYRRRYSEIDQSICNKGGEGLLSEAGKEEKRLLVTRGPRVPHIRSYIIIARIERIEILIF